MRGGPKNVLLLVRELTIGGCERDLTKMALGLDRSRFVPHVGCFHPNGHRGDELRAAGIPILKLPVQSFYSLSTITAARLMGRYLREHRIQVVHAYDVPTDIFAVPVAKFYGVPAIVSCQLSFRWMYTPLYQCFLRFTDRFADVVVANSKAVQRHLIEDEHLPPERTNVCYNGVETDVFHPEPRQRQAAVADAPLVIGSVCALRREKRIDLLLEAFAKVRSLRPGIKLLLVGSGAMQAELEHQRRALGLESDCVMEPAKSEVADWMRSMDIFVTCSDSESFPNALLEAMACGCAVVGSNVGGIPELVEDTRSGLIFPPGDAGELAAKLACLIENPEYRQRLAQAAATRAEREFSMEKAVERTQNLWDRLLESHYGILNEDKRADRSVA